MRKFLHSLYPFKFLKPNQIQVGDAVFVFSEKRYKKVVHIRKGLFDRTMLFFKDDTALRCKPEHSVRVRAF